MQRAKEKIAQQAGERPRTEGFDLEDSTSTTSTSTAPQEVLDSQGAIVLAKAEDSRWEAEEEEEEEDDDDDAEDDSPCAPPSSTTAATIPTDTMDMMTYEIVGDDATVDSTVVEEEREVVADISSSYDGGKGTAKEEQEKQKGDPDPW